MKKGKIPTIIGIVVLVFGLAAGVIAVQSKLFLRLGATGESSPQNVRITDIASNSVSVSWTTDIKTTGFVNYGEEENSFTNTQIETSESPSRSHLIKITGLKPLTPYFFKINSGGESFDNNGVSWQIKTGAEKAPETTLLVSGNVLTAAGTPVVDALVYISAGTTTFSSLVSQNGNWIISIPASLNDSVTVLEISIQAGADGISTAQIYPASANPVPTMILGQTHDFKNVPSNQDFSVPKASIDVPEETIPVSGFDVAETAAHPSIKTVTLESIKDGEVINTTKPELLGDAPPGIILAITVESEVIGGEVTVSDSGEWNWEVPSDLLPGDHKITITWTDEAGITRTLVRSFVVSAAEGPAFEATPSATPTFTPAVTPVASPSTTPTATPEETMTPTPSSVASIPETPIPQPLSGSLTPTVFLSIMGIGLIIFGFIFWKQSNA